MDSVKFISNLANEVTEIPSQSILSRTIFKDEKVKVILFSFAEGQELSEHTASVAAVIQVLSGEAQMKLGGDEYHASSGCWVHLQPNTPHTIVAKTPLLMLLTMFV